MTAEEPLLVLAERAALAAFAGAEHAFDDLLVTLADCAPRHPMLRIAKGFALDANHRAHVTLVQRFVLTRNLDKVHAAVGKVFANARQSRLAMEAFKHYYIPDKDLGLAGISIQPTPELRKLEQRVIAAVTPFAVKTGDSSAFVTTPDDPVIHPALITYVGEFVPKHSGKHFDPPVARVVQPGERGFATLGSRSRWPDRCWEGPPHLDR